MGGGISRFDIDFDQNEGKNELLPIPAGSLLKGKVIIETTKEMIMPKAAATEAITTTAITESAVNNNNKKPIVLDVRLYGKEKVRMNPKKAKVYQRGNDNAGKHSAERFAERSLLDLHLQWNNFPDPIERGKVIEEGKSIPAGRYIFPFAIQLPNILPSSTYYPTNDVNRKRSKMRFRIQYKIVAKTILFNTNKHVTKYIWIKASTTTVPEPIPCMIEPITHELKGNTGFFGGNGKKGHILFGASVDNCRVLCQDNNNQQQINLHISCRNDSSVEIQRVQIKVIEKLIWGTMSINNINETTGNVIKTTSLQQTETRVLSMYNDIQLPGLSKERKGILQKAYENIIGGGSDNNLYKLRQQIYDDLISGENLIPIQIPENNMARETFDGTLIQISHAIVIEFQTGSYLRNSPSLEIPIYISSNVKPLITSEQNNNNLVSYFEVTDYTPYAIANPTAHLLPASTGIVEQSNNNNNNKPNGKKTKMDDHHGGGEEEIPLAQNVIQIDNEEEEIEIANATTADATTSNSVIVLGGDARAGSSIRQMSNSNNNTYLTGLVPLAPPKQIDLETLINDMRSSINDYELILEKLSDSDWLQYIQTLSPNDYGCIINTVQSNLDQVRIAILIANNISNVKSYTCEHISKAIENMIDHRIVLIQKLFPSHVIDIENKDLIYRKLNEWEQTVVADLFL